MREPITVVTSAATIHSGTHWNKVANKQVNNRRYLRDCDIPHHWKALPYYICYPIGRWRQLSWWVWPLSEKCDISYYCNSLYSSLSENVHKRTSTTIAHKKKKKRKRRENSQCQKVKKNNNSTDTSTGHSLTVSLSHMYETHPTIKRVRPTHMWEKSDW